jgi:hypothetical protein
MESRSGLKRGAGLGLWWSAELDVMGSIMMGIYHHWGRNADSNHLNVQPCFTLSPSHAMVRIRVSPMDCRPLQNAGAEAIIT